MNANSRQTNKRGKSNAHMSSVLQWPGCCFNAKNHLSLVQRTITYESITLSCVKNRRLRYARCYDDFYTLVAGSENFFSFDRAWLLKIHIFKLEEKQKDAMTRWTNKRKIKWCVVEEKTDMRLCRSTKSSVCQIENK